MSDSEHSPPPRERKVSVKIKKPPPLKKRHTKPCKFFQFGRCSNTAEECNFAHVLVLPGLALSPPLAMSPTAGAGGVCKFFVLGQCPSERVCGLRHIHGVDALGAQLSGLQLASASSLSPSVPTPYSGSYPYPSPYAPYPPYYTPWSQGSYGEHPNAGLIRNGGYPAAGSHSEAESPSVSLSISASTDSSRLDTPGADGSVGALGLTGMEKQPESGVRERAVINVNSLHDYDDDNIVTEDPQFSEHAYNQHQSRVRVMDGDPNSMAPGYHSSGTGGAYPLALPLPWDAGGMHYYSQATGFGSGDKKVSVTRSSSCTSSRSKSATRKYKTKPCKYFTAENECPNGDSCTFMHDASIPPVPPINRSHSKSPTSPANSDDHDTASPRGTVKNDGNSEKDESQGGGAEDEDNKEKNFFPITWRVIGGGVLMGGKQTENPEGGGAYSVEAQAGNSPPAVSPGLESHCKGVVEIAAGGRGFLRFGGVATRPRSSSASTPGVRPRAGNHIRRGNINLFSAESP